MRWIPILPVALLVLGGCVSAPPPQGPEVLVTFPLPEARIASPGGSKRIYPSRVGWQTPLYTRQQVRAFARDHDLVMLDAWPIEPLGVYCVSTAG